jgi:hypothetical protein
MPGQFGVPCPRNGSKNVWLNWYNQNSDAKIVIRQAATRIA